MTGELLCVGDLNADITITAVEAIAVGSDTPGSVVMSGGGSAANVAAWAAEAGADGFMSRFVGVVGDDELGDFLIDELAGHGVDVRVIRRESTASRAIAAIVGGDGNRSMVSALDPATVLGTADVDPAWYDGVGWLHLTGYTFLQSAGRATFARLIASAEERSMPWSLDPSSATMLAAGAERGDVADAFAGAAVMFPSHDEAEWLADAADPVAAAELLLDLSDTVVVTCGADGAVVARRGSPTFSIEAAPAALVNTLG
ncbi:carbohydrate kinase family protein, partial [Ilumatobacter sp.]|uniref:carbohydrate kinase family protein n=1 Tax=Ilumatobacter sp. TaxID=1967498 RepID=UPI003C4FFBAA